MLEDQAATYRMIARLRLGLRIPFIDGGAEVGSKGGLSFLSFFEALFVVMRLGQTKYPSLL